MANLREQEAKGLRSAAADTLPPWADEVAAEPKKLRPLKVTVHFERETDKHLALKITLPVSWEARSCREALVEPFMKAYAKKRPETAAHSAGPFEFLRVESWGGPRPCAADPHEKRPNGHADPLHLLLPAEAEIGALRAVARVSQHAWDQDAIEAEIVPQSSTALVLRETPSHALVTVGERLNRMLSDGEVELAAMHALVDATIEQGELAYRGLATARDGRGRTPLHNCVTRGDLTLCRKLMRTREAALAVDNNRDNALTIAALAGRQLIVRELVEAEGALGRLLLHEKNRDLMSPLQLACVDESQGNGEVVRLLVEAGADIDALCWDLSPLCAAAAGGHHWAVKTLLELGADVHTTNGYYMGPLDYARDQDTAQLILDYMEERLLPDHVLLESARAARQQRAAAMPDGDGRERGPRLFQSVAAMALEDAFKRLEAPEAWLAPFRASGAHMGELRRRWRALVLANHPDKLTGLQLGEREIEARAATFAAAMAAFEAIDAYYTERFAPPEPPAAPGDVAPATSGAARPPARAPRTTAATGAQPPEPYCSRTP